MIDEVSGEALVAKSRINNLEDMVEDIVQLAVSPYYDIGDLDYKYAQVMSKLVRVEGLVKVLKQDITNTYLIKQEET